jgi:iron complex outermembrane receptor protein
MHARKLKQRSRCLHYFRLWYDRGFFNRGSWYENYSDFGILGKLTRYKLNSDVIRASFVLDLELGIAPNLLSNIQTLVSGGTISNQGTFNNVDPAVIGLGVPRLHAEKSQNNRNYI